jgi:protein-disulfide isomerase
MMSAPKNPLYFGLAFAFVLLLCGGLYIYSNGMSGDASDMAEQAPAAGDATAATPEAVSAEFNLEAALSERVLGDTTAPLKISEHSSFTCGHCGAFHKETFKKFKEAYIDTGKAYLVFSDFPLNAPALHASMAARCIPQERYFDFVDVLYAEQDVWAYEVGYLTYLKQKSGEFGLSGEGFDACLKNEALQAGILERVKAAQTQWNISSTPSFVLNNKRTVSGAASFEEFSKVLDEELAGGTTETPEEITPSSE